MSEAELIRVMIVDDHPVMRSGLQDVLEASGRFEVVGQAEDGQEAVDVVEGLNPDVIIMDVIMPGKDGIEACREIMYRLPDVRVMILTASTEEDAVVEAIAAGATGYLQKYSRPEELVQTVADVAQDRLRMPEGAVKKVFAMLRDEYRLPTRQSQGNLTALERETLVLFASGKSYAQIAEGEGQQRCYHPQHHLPDSGQAGHREQAGAGGLGRSSWSAGRSNVTRRIAGNSGSAISAAEPQDCK